MDGCRGGWCLALGKVHSEDIKVRCEVFPTFAQAVGAASGACDIAVDIPIGLTEGEPRKCDLQARKVLGARGVCVFSAPPRFILATLAGKPYAEAKLVYKERCGPGLTAQAYGIMPKIAEVDRYLRSQPDIRDRIWEVHPELCFRALNGGAPLMVGKKEQEGRRARRALLAPFVVDLERTVRQALATHLRRVLKEDDVLDALAACVTAATWVPETTIPAPMPPIDSCWLRMEMRCPASGCVRAEKMFSAAKGYEILDP
jgi:predicted RNase H-like nuclease